MSALTVATATLASFVSACIVLFFVVGLLCKSHIDEVRTIKLGRLLEKVASLLNEEGVQYWLDFGTLLGFVREGGIIDGDLDCDIGILERDRGALGEVTAKLLSVGVMSIESENMVKYFEEGDANINLDIYFYGCDLRVQQIYHLDEGQSNYYQDVFPLRESRVFPNTVTYMPNNADAYLTARYGRDYMTPMPHRKTASSYDRSHSMLLGLALTWRDILGIKRH